MSATEGICRMCHKNTGLLVSPCLCGGSLKYVHSKCLSDWVCHRRSLSCEVCGAMYSVSKVVNYHWKDGPPGIFVLCWICAKHYITQCLSMLPFLLLFSLIAFLIPLIATLLHYAVPPFTSVSIPWYSIVHMVPEVGEFRPMLLFIVGWEFTVYVTPLFLFWVTWRRWFMLQEGMLDIYFGEEDDGGEQQQHVVERQHGIPTGLMGSNVDADDESDDDDDELQEELRRGHLLIPATLPDENATVLEAITLARPESNNSFGGGLFFSDIINSSVEFICFYVTIWMFLKFSPEIMRLGVAFVWKSFHGSYFCTFILEKILHLVSTSEGNARMRYAMFMLLADAVRSSRLLAWSFTHVRRNLTLWIFWRLARRLRHLPYRKKIISLVVYFRGMLNLLLLVCYTILALCLLTSLLCMDYFVVDTSLTPNDYEEAWKIVSKTPDTKMRHLYLFDYLSEVDTSSYTSSPVTILRALNVLSKMKENNTCWNFGDLRGMSPNYNTGFNNNNNNNNNNSSSSSSSNKTFLVEGDDPLLFPLFASIVFVSKVDSISVVETGYMAVYFALFFPYLMQTISQIIPPQWLRWSSLYKLLHSPLFESIAYFDTKAFFLVFGEILLYIVLGLCTILRYSLVLLRAFDTSAVPVVLMASPNTLPFTYWLRMSFLRHTIPQELLEIPQKFLASMLGNLFDIWEVMQGAPLSFPHFLSRAVRIFAFVVCYWLFNVVMLTAYTLPGLFVLGRKASFLRLIFLFVFYFRLVIRAIFPHVMPHTREFVKYLFLQLRLTVIHWRRRWWFASCLGFWLGNRLRRDRNVVGYNVEAFRNMPLDVHLRIESVIETICNHLDKYRQTRYSAHFIDQLQVKLKSLAFPNYKACFLTEEDVSLLLECLNLPSLQRSFCYFLNCVVLVVFLPFMAGVVGLMMIRRLISEPFCNGGINTSLALFSWNVGLFLTIALYIMNVKRSSGPGRLLLYLLGGCHNFTARDAMTFLLVPHFRQLASVTFVPHTLCNLLQLFFIAGDGVKGGVVFYVMASLLLFLTWRASLKIGGVVWRRWNPLLLLGGAARDEHVDERRRERAGEMMRMHVLQYTIRQLDLGAPLAEGRRLMEDEARRPPEAHARAQAPQQVNVVKILCQEVVVNTKAFFSSVSESTLRFLTRLAEKENVVGVVFVNHTSMPS